MSLSVKKIVSKSYLDGNSTPEIKAGTNFSMVPSASGDYTLSTNLSSGNPVFALTATTVGSEGTVTVDLTPYAFVNPPLVTLCTVNTSSGVPLQATTADIVTVTNTSLVIRTFQSQSTTVVLVGINVVPFVKTAGIVVHIHLAQV